MSQAMAVKLALLESLQGANAIYSSEKFHMERTVSRDRSQDTTLAVGGKIGIMDLPPELRNRIYFFTLVTESRIRITRHKDKARRRWKPKGGRKMTIDDKIALLAYPTLLPLGYIVEGTTKTENGKKSKKEVVSSMRLFNVLRVSKTLNAEAAPIAYGSNKFTFESGHALSQFKTEVGKNFALLKNITIEDFRKQHPREVFRELAALKAPSRVAIPNLQDWLHRDIKSMATDIMTTAVPFVKNRAGWGNHSKLEPGFHIAFPIRERSTQRQRLESLFIHGAKAGEEVLGADSEEVEIVDEDHGNALIKSALLEIWEEDFDQRE